MGDQMLANVWFRLFNPDTEDKRPSELSRDLQRRQQNTYAISSMPLSSNSRFPMESFAEHLLFAAANSPERGAEHPMFSGTSLKRAKTSKNTRPAPMSSCAVKEWTSAVPTNCRPLYRCLETFV